MSQLHHATTMFEFAQLERKLKVMPIYREVYRTPDRTLKASIIANAKLRILYIYNLEDRSPGKVQTASFIAELMNWTAQNGWHIEGIPGVVQAVQSETK